MWLPLAFLVLILHDASAWTAMEVGAVLPSAPTKCYVKSQRKILSAGASWQPPGKCMIINCEGTTTMPNGKKAFALEYMGCGSVSSMPPCELVPENPSLPYPDCCENIRCPDEMKGHTLMDMKDTYALMEDTMQAS